VGGFKMKKTKNFLIVIVIYAAGFFALEYFNPPVYVILGIVILVLYLYFENQLEKISFDLRMVETILEEKYPEEFSAVDEFTRKF
jgi:hypothetical protein